MNAMRVVGKSKDLEGSEETPAQTPQEDSSRYIYLKHFY